ncbi:TcpE family conjugal transfer membrane protein, partial [Enterococcus gallinarum]
VGGANMFQFQTLNAASNIGQRNIEAVEEVLDQLNIPISVTFNQMAWFVLSLLFVIVFAHVPPLSMIEGAFLKYLGIPVAVTWFMSQKTFDGKKPLGFLRSFISYHLRFKVTFAGKKVKEQKKRWDEPITLVRSVNYVPD